MGNSLIGNPTEIHPGKELNTKEEEFDTDVEGVKANGYVEMGTDKFPKFNVSQEEFAQNLQDGRRRLRWKSDSPVQKYMSGTKYRRPFFITYKDDNGRVFTRKIK